MRVCESERDRKLIFSFIRNRKKRKGRNEPKTLFPLNKLLRWSLIPETLKSTFILVICNISLFCIVEYSKSVVTMHFVSPANKKIFLANYGCCDKRGGGG